MMRTSLALRGFLAACLLLGGGSAWGQGTKRSVEIKAQPVADLGTPEQKKKDDQKGPRFNAEMNLMGRKSREEMSEDKFKEALALLRKLIQATPDNDPAKPDLFDRLSEMYWQRSSDLTIRAFDKEAQCQKTAKPGQEQACTAERERGLAGAQKYRDDAIEVYKSIVKTFPQYPRLDGVLFALGYNYQQKQQPDAAKRFYAEVIKRYPDSKYVADTLTNIGEIYFDAGEVDQALKAYQKVVTNYKDADTYGYALYKLGWCFMNTGDYKQSLAQFLMVIKYTKDQTGKRNPNKISLYKESIRDLVRSYVNIPDANPNQAIAFFRKAAPDDYIQLAENLAEQYSTTGQVENSNKLYRDLIGISPTSYKVVQYEMEIAFNTRNMSRDSTEIVKEVKRLVDLWRKVRDAKDADPKKVAHDREKIEELVRSLSVQMHIQWMKTKNPDDYAISYELYKDYIEVFPDGPNIYTISFYYGELSYAGQKWGEAAKAYEHTLALKPDGEFTADAAQGQVLAYKKLIDIRQDKGANNVAETDSKPGEDAATPKAKPLSEDQQKFIKACDVYAKFVKDSEYLVDIEYDAARLYYDANQFDEAVPRFKDISEKHPEHRLAVFAANLLLDAYNLKGDMEVLDKQVDSFLKIYTPQRDPEFYALLVKLKQQSSFKKCQGIERGKEWVRAATCYKSYAANYPQSEFVDKSYYNAALNYEREKMLEQSIEMKLKIVNDVPQSPLVPKALYQIAGNLHALAIYSQAAKIYEAYAEKFPKEENARDALRNAAVFRQGLGDYDQALADAAAYMKLIGAKPDEAAEVFFTMGLTYEKQEKWDNVISHFNDYLKKFAKAGKVDLTLESYVHIGNAYQHKKDEPSAQKAYNTSYTAYTKLTDAEKQGLTTGLGAVAEARFKMGEAVRAEFDTVKLKIFPYKNVKKFVEEMSKVIIKKSDLIAKARTIYLEVIELRSANWAIAALTRIGQMYQQLANDTYDAPVPVTFDEEQVETYKGAMAERAQPVEAKAIEAYITAVKKAQELRWFNEYSDTAAKELARLSPKEYRYDAEARAKPDRFSSPTFHLPFITTLPAQEEQ